jgi:hypothetical protein
MAAIQKSQDIDTLSVRKIFAKGDNNTTLPANSILLTDGNGGTKWIDEQTFQRGVNFNTFETSRKTFVSGPGSTKFSILDGENAGLLSDTANNSVYMYANAFGQINVPNQDSIYSRDPVTSVIHSNVQIVGSGIIDITTNTQQNKIEFYSPDNGLSSLSSVIENFKELNGYIGDKIASFKSPFSTFIYDAISSYSTMYKLNTEILNTSTVEQQGVRQPFIQRGSGVLSSDEGIAIISLSSEYLTNDYTVQLTYRKNNGPPSNKLPLVVTNVNTNNFKVYGDINGKFHWTTLGDLF